MITYAYKCKNCTNELTVEQSIKDSPIVHCENCGQNTLERVISGGLCTILKVDEPKTLGLLSDRNGKKFGKQYIAEKSHEIKNKNRKNRKYTGKLKEGAVQEDRSKIDFDYKPPWRDGPIDKSLAKLKGKSLENYLLTGKKPSSED